MKTEQAQSQRQFNPGKDDLVSFMCDVVSDEDKTKLHTLAALAAEKDLDVTDVLMDLQAVHAVHGLRLDDMLECAGSEDNFSFWHDVYGIGRHLNRTTGELTNCFLPRFHRRAGARHANSD